MTHAVHDAISHATFSENGLMSSAIMRAVLHKMIKKQRTRVCRTKSQVEEGTRVLILTDGNVVLEWEA